MWRWALCILLTLPFLILPVLWFTFPTTCQDGHIHYTHTHENDTAIHEPWHCHIPRMSGCACTPGYDCFTGGIYGPTNNGGILIIVVVAGLFALFYCSSDHEHNNLEYKDYEMHKSRSNRAAKTAKTGVLNAYPLR